MMPPFGDPISEKNMEESRDSKNKVRMHPSALLYPAAPPQFGSIPVH